MAAIMSRPPCVAIDTLVELAYIITKAHLTSVFFYFLGPFY